MALFLESDVRSRAQRSINESKSFGRYAVEAASLLTKSAAEFSEAKTYDIFLSHSIKDSDLILGVKGTLEDLGYSVYVDWIEDKQLDRSKVTPATADLLKQRMNSSKSLLYVTTENADNSKWMPWECGYFDGLKEKVAIAPVVKKVTTSYKGQEYLGLYPYCDKRNSDKGNEMLWVFRDSSTYVSFDSWKDSRTVTWKKLNGK